MDAYRDECTGIGIAYRTDGHLLNQRLMYFQSRISLRRRLRSQRHLDRVSERIDGLFAALSTIAPDPTSGHLDIVFPSEPERACSISMDLVDAEDCSSPPSFRIGLSRARRKNQMFGTYEEAVSVSIRDLRQAPTSQQYPAHSLPPILVSAITDCDVLREMLALHGGFVLRVYTN
nr:unnamed protein product [Spirometra erinaceieuropaei]